MNDHHVLLTCEVGSTATGMAIEGQDDRDELGIYLENPEEITGLQVAKTIVQRDRPEGVRSQPGDLDLVLHPLQKWMRLALKGNPTVLALLWAPIVEDGDPGPGGFTGYLREVGPSKIVSKRAGGAFLGYLQNQKRRLIEGKSMRVNRPELIEQYGYDTKFAAHALRLGLQGAELMETGKLEYPMGKWLKFVRDVREGKVEYQTAVDDIQWAEDKLRIAIATSDLPDEPDREWANEFLHETYRWEWE